MMPVGIIVATVLAALAGLHIYWATGGVWPGTDEKSCARTVAGFRGIEKMPSIPETITVAILLSAAALLALVLGVGNDMLPAWLLVALGAAASLVFAGRGVAGYLPAWRRLTPEMPFAAYDVRYYSPLCLTLGASFAFLTVSGTTP